LAASASGAIGVGHTWVIRSAGSTCSSRPINVKGIPSFLCAAAALPSRLEWSSHQVFTVGGEVFDALEPVVADFCDAGVTVHTQGEVGFGQQAAQHELHVTGGLANDSPPPPTRTPAPSPDIGGVMWVIY
jgi:hypothetical protein